MKRTLNATLMLLTLTMLLTITSCEPWNGNDTNYEQNDQVVMLGDSIFDLSDEIGAELERLSGQTYRAYYVSGSEFERSLIGTNIPEQYQQARRANPNIRTIITDGGGNDIQIGAAGACTTARGATAACKAALQPALNAADELFQQMRDDGVENIVYMNYFYIMARNSKPAFDWMHDQMEALVLKHGGLVIEVMPYMKDAYIKADNIHPKDPASDMLANLIWDGMVEHCIEQGPNCTGAGSGTGVFTGNPNTDYESIAEGNTGPTGCN